MKGKRGLQEEGGPLPPPLLENRPSLKLTLSADTLESGLVSTSTHITQMPLP